MIDPFTASVLSIVLLALLGLPVGHAMIASSILYLMLAGQDMGIAAEQLLNGMFSSYILLAVPLFILAAELMNSGSITLRLLAFCNAFIGRFPGGLALVNVAQSIIFAGMSGSAIADAAGSGKMMQRMMTEGGKYPPAFASALTASTAVIGPIIPPSIPMVIYALVSDASIGYLFLAGVVPGILMGLVQAGIIVASARRRAFPVERPVPLRELPGITLDALPALMMPVVLLGGIYGGVTTPTEAAAVAALYALLVSAILYRSVSVASVYGSVLSSARTTASIGMLIAGALVFNYVVTVENIPASLSAWLAGFDLTPIAFLLMVNVILLILGCLLEGTTILLVIVPVFIPTANALGIDLVHFGIVCVVNIMLGLITPPCQAQNNVTELLEAVYTSEPMDQDMAINGPIGGQIWASTTALDSNVVVRVSVVDPNGLSRELSNGIQMASMSDFDATRSRFMNGKLVQPWHPFTAESQQPVGPLQPFRADVEVFPTSAVIPAGHRLRISVGASDLPHGLSPLPDLLQGLLGLLTVYSTPAMPSRVNIPLVPADALQ